MADNNQNPLDAVRGELNTLRTQLEGLVKNMEDKKNEFSHDAAGKLARELEHYRSLAQDKAQKVYSAGQAGLEEVGDQVRQNPFLSLGVAFGAGLIISCLLHRLR